MSTPAKRNDEPFFTKEQIKLISEHLLKGAPEFELQRFLITCERTGLDPFSRQIYGHIQNKKVMRGKEETWIPTVVIITSIDGFRAIAERSGKYAGQTEPRWYYANDEGVSDWHDVCIIKRDKNGNPISVPDACRVGILRDGFQGPCYGVANFASFAKYYRDKETKEYYLDTFWKKMPEHMIAKVAEAQGHRKAFPLLAQGIYIEEELKHEDDVVPPTVTSTLPAGATTVQKPTSEERAANVANALNERAHANREQTEEKIAEHLKDEPPYTVEQLQKAGLPNASKAQTGTGTAPEPEKRATEAPAAKKTRSKKSSEPEKPAPETKKPEPQTDPLFADTDQPKEAWKGVTLTVLPVIKEYNGRKFGAMTKDEIAYLHRSWVVKHGAKIKEINNPDKVAQAKAIEAGFLYYGGDPKNRIFV